MAACDRIWHLLDGVSACVAEITARSGDAFVVKSMGDGDKERVVAPAAEERVGAAGRQPLAEMLEFQHRR